MMFEKIKWRLFLLLRWLGLIARPYPKGVAKTREYPPGYKSPVE